jgi:hypothetical protein
MKTTSVLASLLTLTFGAAAMAQDQPPANSSASVSSSVGAQSHQPAAPDTASSPHQRIVTSQAQTEATPTPGAGPTAAASPHQRTVLGKVQEGMAVEDRSGQPLGSVSKILSATGGSPGYVLISPPAGGAAATPVPTAVASSMTANGHIVMDRAALQGAPKVQLTNLDANDTQWRKKTDRYWSSHGN